MVAVVISVCGVYNDSKIIWVTTGANLHIAYTVCILHDICYMIYAIIITNCELLK